MAVYSKKYKSLKELPKGATVYVSNNPAEQGRFLKFFVDAGLIKIKKGVKIEDAKFSDITENKKILSLIINNQQNSYLKFIKMKTLMLLSLIRTLQSNKN